VLLKKMVTKYFLYRFLYMECIRRVICGLYGYFSFYNYTVGGLTMKREKEYLWKCKGGVLKLSENDIWYLHTEQKKTFIHTRKRVYQIFTSLKEAERHLWEMPVMRVHQGYLTHLTKVEALVGNEMTLKNGERIPVSATRRKTVLSELQIMYNKAQNT